MNNMMGYNLARSETMMGYDFEKSRGYDFQIENILGLLQLFLLWEMILLGELPVNWTDFPMRYDFASHYKAPRNTTQKTPGQPIWIRYYKNKKTLKTMA